MCGESCIKVCPTGPHKSSNEHQMFSEMKSNKLFFAWLSGPILELKKKKHRDITHGAKVIFSRDYRLGYFLKGATCNVVLQTDPTVKAAIKSTRARLPAPRWTHRHQTISHTYQHVLSGHRTASWTRTGILVLTHSALLHSATPNSAL